MKTNIEGILAEWFEEFKSLLQSSPPVRRPENMVALINSSLATLDNYLGAAMMILSAEQRLPAKALLRVSGELIAKITWLLNGNNNDEQQNRLKRWIKTSYRKANKYDKEIIAAYGNDGRDNARNRAEGGRKAIDVRSREISELERDGIEDLPRVSDIFKDTFGKGKLQAGMYSQYLPAIHPDLLVLTESITESVSGNQTETTFTGDTKEDIHRLKLDCLAQARIFLNEIAKYYNGDFKKLSERQRKETAIPGFPLSRE